MAKRITEFEEIIAWQKSRELYLLLYKVFSRSKDYFMKDQILRATLSISNNIAEGFERETKKDFKKFLFISKGSCAEVRSMLVLCKDTNLISEDLYIESKKLSLEISKLLSGFIKTLY